MPGFDSQTKLPWLGPASTGSPGIAASRRLRCSITRLRRRSTSPSPSYSAYSIATWVSALTPSGGAIASSSREASVEPTT